MDRILLALFSLSVFLLNGGLAQSEMPKDRIGIDERLGDIVPPDTAFRDENGREVRVGDIIDRPTIISLVYLSCTHTCPLLLGSLAEALDKADLSPGKDYNVMTISFDEQDTPGIAREKKVNYVTAAKKNFSGASWRFLTGDKDAIARFTEAVGFNFRKDPAGFSHPVVLIVLSPERKIVRYLYGQSFLPFDITMAVTEASKGTVGLSVKRLFLFCYSYDPPGRKYVFNILKVYGVVTILSMASLFLYLTLKKKRQDGEKG